MGLGLMLNGLLMGLGKGVWKWKERDGNRECVFMAWDFILILLGTIYDGLGIVFLHDLEVECVIGVWEWERRIHQKVIIDLDMGWDTGPAAASDDLKDTLSYKDVAKRVTAFVQGTRANLVESLAKGIADILLGEFGVQWCRVRVNKRGAVTGARDVGVVIERGVR